MHSDRIGAPGTGISRRDFLKATGATGAVAVAGCAQPPTAQQVPASGDTAFSTQAEDLPPTGPPEVVDLDELGGEASAVAGSVEGDAAAVYGDWFDTVDNFAGTVDRRGEDVVTVTVGAAGNGGAFGFGPAAVQVDPGTTIRWVWSGEGGVHNVVASDGSFASEMSGDAGHVFGYVAEDRGVHTYACEPHAAMG
jgi:halocyanin-like protein